MKTIYERMNHSGKKASFSMNLVSVSKKCREYNNIKRLYQRAFPPDERAPFCVLAKKAKRGKADFWALFDGEKWVGLAYAVTHGELAYLFYLAIAENERCRGYGKSAMDALKTQYAGKKFFLAMESLNDKAAENFEQRIRRHEFYLKCGLVDLPYHIKEASVVYDIMGTGAPVEPEEYRAMMAQYMGRISGRLVDLRIIK